MSIGVSSTNKILITLILILFPWEGVWISKVHSSISPVKLLVVLLAVLILLQAVYFGRISLKSKQSIVASWAMVFFSLSSILWAGNVSSSIEKVSGLAGLVFVYYAASAHPFREESFIKLVWLFLFSIGLLSIVAVVNNTWWRGVRIIPVSGYNPSWFGAYLAVGFFCVLYVFSKVNSCIRLFLILLLVFLFSLFLLTQSRNSMLALLLSAVFFYFYAAYNKLIKGKAVGLLGLVFAGLVALLSSASIGFLLSEYFGGLERISSIVNADKNEATAGRIYIWMTSLKHSPWLTGVGIGNHVDYFRGLTGWGAEAHNQWVNMYVEQGVFGLLLFFFFIYSLTKRTLLLFHHSAVISSLGLFAILLSFGNDVVFYGYFWVPVILVAIYSTSRNGRVV